MNTSLPQITTRRCSQCNSPLILVETITEEIPGHFAPVTTNVYKCSDESCQDQKDKETAKRIKQAEEKESAAEKRAQVKAQEKADIQAKKLEESSL